MKFQRFTSNTCIKLPANSSDNNQKSDQSFHKNVGKSEIRRAECGQKNIIFELHFTNVST